MTQVLRGTFASQGGESNRSGSFLETAIEHEFRSRQVPVFEWNSKNENGDLFAERFLLRHVPYISIYGSDSRSEFVYRDFRLSSDIRIECRWQQSPGSVDEKLPYLFMNAAEAMPEREIWFVVDGGGARRESIEWLKRRSAQFSAKTIRVLSIPDARMQIRRVTSLEG